jgi:predicted nuclease of predicted toxin-antitoxin system
VRFLIDMPLSPNLAAWLRDQGLDALHATEMNLATVPDAVILARAKQDG